MCFPSIFLEEGSNPARRGVGGGMAGRGSGGVLEAVVRVEGVRAVGVREENVLRTAV